MLLPVLPLFAALCACTTPELAQSDGRHAAVAQASSGTLTWKGYDWNVTTGGMAGVAEGDPSNVSVDSNGYLHLKITKNGTTWTAAELYSATNLGFGTYQWQVSGPIDRMDHTVVLGLSPYGPAAGVGTDGYNEIDTEFSQWNDEIGHVNMDWGVYPATKAGKHAEDDFFFSLNGGTETTTRMVWSSTSVVSTVFSGFVPLGASTNQLNTNTYAPADPTDNIPQQAVPVLLNLWCYEAVPSSGNDVEVILQDFQFIPEGQPIPGADASAGPVDAATPEGGASSDDAGGSGSDATVSSSGGGSGSGSGGNGTSGGSGSGSGGGSGSGSGSGGSTAGLDGAIGNGSEEDAAPAGASSGSKGGCSVGAAGTDGQSNGLAMALVALGAIAFAGRKRTPIRPHATRAAMSPRR